MPHFAARFKNARFVIHDVSRKIAGIYNGNEWLVSPVGTADIVLSENEESFSALWKNTIIQSISLRGKTRGK